VLFSESGPKVNVIVCLWSSNVAQPFTGNYILVTADLDIDAGYLINIIGVIILFGFSVSLLSGYILVGGELPQYYASVSV